METEEDNYYDIENGTIGYPIHYCPICGEKLK